MIRHGYSGEDNKELIVVSTSSVRERSGGKSKTNLKSSTTESYARYD